MSNFWQSLELGSAVFAILVTLLVYRGSLLLFEKSGHNSLFHPLISGPLVVAAAIALLPITFTQYQSWVALLTWLLGPATVALAIPLYHQAANIRAHAIPIILTVFIGGCLAVASALASAALLGADDEVLRSLASKSITTPIALALSEIVGGIGQLAAGAVIITGVTGALVAPAMLRRLGITDKRVIGLTLGITAHGIGTARAFDIDAQAGAYASLGMGLTGILTALILPLLFT
jgi:predicted murein hydrolase (TIGR00659 family)